MIKFLIFCFIVGFLIYWFKIPKEDSDFYCPYCYNTNKAKIKYVGDFNGGTVYECLKCGNKVFD